MKMIYISHIHFHCGRRQLRILSIVENVDLEIVICLHPQTSISANADGPRDAASRKIDHIALPIELNYQATSVGWW